MYIIQYTYTLYNIYIYIYIYIYIHCTISYIDILVHCLIIPRVLPITNMLLKLISRTQVWIALGAITPPVRSGDRMSWTVVSSTSANVNWS